MHLAELATRQHGVAHVAQLCAAGITATTIRRRIRDGSWQLVLPRVVALHPGRLSDDARRHAACLWLPEGVLYGATAATVHGIKARPTTRVHIAVLSGHPRCRPWVHVRRLRDLPRAHVTRAAGLPVTSAARTVVDVHDETVGHADRAALVADAVQRQLVRPGAIIAAAVTTPGLRRRSELGATVLRILGGAQSHAELAFGDFCAAWRLSEPLPQYPIPTRLGVLHVDFAFVAERVAVEIDGREGHASETRRRRDHDRDSALAAVGWLVIRLTPRRLVTSSELVFADLVSALGRRRTTTPA